MTIRITEVIETAGQREIVDLLSGIWRGGGQLVDSSLLRALSQVGNYVAGAYVGGQLIGAAVGFLAADGHLHSHITGVAAGHRASGVGYALKQHQRRWAIERQLTRVSWTYDPLVRRNAYFNVHKLGAEPVEYLPDFYGPMTDGINAGDATDRLFVDWELASPRATDAAAGRLVEADLTGAAIGLGRDGDAPGSSDRRCPYDDSRVLVAMPSDIEKLRGTTPELAKRWRYAVREALISALAAGLRITEVSPEGWYVLIRPEEKR